MRNRSVWGCFAAWVVLVSEIYKNIQRPASWMAPSAILQISLCFQQGPKESLLSNGSCFPHIWGTLQNRKSIMNTFGGDGVSQGPTVFPLWKPCREPPWFLDLYHQTLFLFPNPSECKKQPDSAGACMTQIISFVQFAIVSSMSG